MGCLVGSCVAGLGPFYFCGSVVCCCLGLLSGLGVSSWFAVVCFVSRSVTVVSCEPIALSFQTVLQFFNLVGCVCQFSFRHCRLFSVELFMLHDCCRMHCSDGCFGCNCDRDLLLEASTSDARVDVVFENNAAIAADGLSAGSFFYRFVVLSVSVLQEVCVV